MVDWRRVRSERVIVDGFLEGRESVNERRERNPQLLQGTIIRQRARSTRSNSERFKEMKGKTAIIYMVNVTTHKACIFFVPIRPFQTQKREREAVTKAVSAAETSLRSKGSKK